MRTLNKENADRIAEQTGVPAFLAMMLEIRGFHTPQAAANFLQGAAGFPTRFCCPIWKKQCPGFAGLWMSMKKLPFMAITTRRNYSHFHSVFLSSHLRRQCDVLHPEREGEGYGMNASAVEKLAEQGVKLIVTVDNGISSHKEVELASQLGMDTVITDHHRPQSVLRRHWLW